MKKLILLGLFMVFGTGFVSAGVDVNINLNLGGPDIEFAEAPTVVLVSPGIYVVPDDARELFFVAGFYWVARGGHWYRCAGPHKQWVLIEEGRVPPGLRKIPPGHYKNWHPGKGNGKGPGHGKGKHK